jgi:hypothetical protein
MPQNGTQKSNFMVYGVQGEGGIQNLKQAFFEADILPVRDGVCFVRGVIGGDNLIEMKLSMAFRGAHVRKEQTFRFEILPEAPTESSADAFLDTRVDPPSNPSL